MEDKTFFNVLIGPFIIFSIVYLILAIVCYLRFRILKRSPNVLQIGNAFYINIFLTCLYRCITSAMSTYFAIAFQRDNSIISLSEFNIIFLDFLYIPDILIWNCFAFLYCQLIIYFYKGHLQQSYQDLQVLRYQDYFQWNSMHLMLITIFLATAIQIIFIALASSSTITITIFLIENSIMSFIIPLVLFITEFKLHFTFSGLPYRSLYASENKGRINKRIIYWGFARTLHGVVDILLISYNLENFKELIPASSNYGEFVLGVFILVGEKILTEIVPYLLIFDMDFMTIFFIRHKDKSKNEEAIENSGEDPLNENLMENNPQYPILSDRGTSTNENKHYSFSSIDDYQINSLPRIDIKMINFEKVEMKRDKGLGVVKLGNKDRIFRLCVREIDIKKISKYIMEENFKDLSLLSTLQNECQDFMVKVKGYDFSVKENRIYLYYDYMPLGSLYSLIHNNDDRKKKYLKTFEEKIKFSLDLAEEFATFHSMQPPLIHGHLNSSNIFVDKNMKPKISDFLLGSFKKYAGIMINYINKSQYTAPEYLEEKGNVVQNCRKPADVYSYGMILWELFTKKEPFQGISLKKLTYLVVKEKSRPKIPEEIPNEIANIIRVCWQHDEEKRPEFGPLVKTLQNFGDFGGN